MSLLLAIIGHLVGDYLLQNDWMALHKKASAWRCLVHACLWTSAVLSFANWWAIPLAGPLLLGAHFLQDHTSIVSWWMDAIGQKQFRTGPCAPWSTIVVDNIWHVLSLWAVWRFLA